MSYPKDYIKQRVDAGCPKCGKKPTVERNAMGDAELVCIPCAWRSDPIDCGFSGGMADALYRRYQRASEAETDPKRADELYTLALMYSGLRRAVY